MAKSTRRKAGNECFAPLHSGVKNCNDVPAQYPSLAHKRRTSCLAMPLLGLFSRALVQNGTMSWWNSIAFPAVKWPI